MKPISTNINSHTKRAIVLSVCVLLFNAICLAKQPQSAKEVKEVKDTTSLRVNERESLFPEKNLTLDKSHFTWGAEAGASIDLTGLDMSTIDVDVLMGYKNAYINLLGAGVGVHRNVQSGDNFIPVYATLQTSFRKQPSLLFYTVKAGYSFNTIDSSKMFGDLMAYMGCGINLSKTRTARSFIQLMAGYRYFNTKHMDMFDKIDRHYIFDASLSIGVLF